MMSLKHTTTGPSTAPSSLSKAITRLAKYLQALRYHLHTLYLFTASDFKTFVIPTLLFSTSVSLSGPLFTTDPSHSLTATLRGIPRALLLIWLNLLVLCVSNQRSPNAIEEDRINKPNRPIPQGRVTSEDARRILLVLLPVVGAIAWAAGVGQDTLILFACTWFYNDLGGSDADWILRNVFVAAGYGVYSLLALRSLNGGADLTPMTYKWLAVVVVVMATTQHIADIKDVEGDRQRNRRTAATMLDARTCRASAAIPTIICSLFCPYFFDLGPFSYLFVMAVGGPVAYRIMMLSGAKSDRLTWKLWALWTCCLFLLPLIKDHGDLVRACAAVREAVCLNGECAASLNLAAVSTVALVVGGKRMWAEAAIEAGNATIGTMMNVPEIRINGSAVL